MLTPARLAVSGPALERLYREYGRCGAVADPIDCVGTYPDPADREIAGFIAAGLAFGRVAGIMASVRAVLAAMGESPAAFVRRFDPARDAAPLLPLVHRWVRGRDVAALLAILRHMLDEAGS